jgi:SAM-dependent methyltransferase
LTCAGGRDTDGPAISYADAAEVWAAYPSAIETLVEELAPMRVCELGGGPNPVLDQDSVSRRGIDYIVVDIDEEELAKGPGGYYRPVVADVTAPDLPERLGSDAFDLVFSVTVAEHIADAAQFHRNVGALLRPGGKAFHFFPTLYSLPFLLNRLLPEALTERALDRLARGARAKEGVHGKFPAHYRWCRGPTSRQIARLERASGLEVTSYVGFFGHAYLSRWPPLQRVVDAVTALLLRRPVATFTSYAFVTLTKPRAEGSRSVSRSVGAGIPAA